jgi:fructose-bisphosphate aldolase class I
MGFYMIMRLLNYVQKTVASPGRGILAMDESNATCGKRLASIGLENTEANRQAYRTLLVTVPGLGECISGAILFEETLYQSTTDGRKIVDVLVEQNIVPGIKVDKVRSTPFQWFLSRE